MHRDCSLEWVQRNRTRSDRMEAIGRQVERLVQRMDGEEGDVAEAVADEVAKVVDHTFRKHCRIAVADRRTLTINVDRPSMVYSMRTRWFSRLRALAPRYCGRSFTRIRFEFGHTGVRLSEPARTVAVGTSRGTKAARRG